MASVVWPISVADESPILAAAEAGRVDLDQGEVVVGRLLDEPRVVGRPVLELDAQGLGALDDVAVGEDVAVGRDDDPGADAGGRLAERREAVGRDAVRGDRDDGLLRLGDDLGEVKGLDGRGARRLRGADRRRDDAGSAGDELGDRGDRAPGSEGGAEDGRCEHRADATVAPAVGPRRGGGRAGDGGGRGCGGDVARPPSSRSEWDRGCREAPRSASTTGVPVDAAQAAASRRARAAASARWG